MSFDIMGNVSYCGLIAFPCLHHDQLHEIQLFDQLIQIERIICQYFRKDDPSLSLKLSGCQERLDLLERTKQRVVNVSV